MRRKISVFAVCLVISVILWMFFYLSNQYRYQVETRIVFVNQPAEKAVALKDSVRAVLTVESTGWSYVFRRLSPPFLEADLSRLEDEEAVKLKDYLTSFNRQTASEHKIVDISPDTVYFDQVARMEKKVPVVLRADIHYRHQYMNHGPVSIRPDSVVVSGPVTEVRPIEQVETVELRLQDVHASIERFVPLDRKNRSNVHLSSQSVLLNVPVDEFTEHTLKVPVEILNNRQHYYLTLIPSTVSLTCYVPVSRFPELGPEDFRLTADLNEWQQQNKNVLKVQVERAPDFVRIVRVRPGNLDFLVYK